MRDTISQQRNRLASKNVFFNIVGRGGAAITVFLCVPLIVATVGAESWGLIGFAVSLTAVSSVLDLGLGATLNREIARFSGQPERQAQRANLLRSYELPVATMALFVSGCIYLSAHWIANSWLDATTLPASTIAYAIKLLAPAVGVQLLIVLYNGALLGLQHQLLSNWARLLYTVALYGGAVVLLQLNIRGGITTFFEWQLLCGAVYIYVLRTASYSYLRGGEAARWNMPYLFEGLPFAIGVAGTGVLVIGLTQTDKLLLSKLLSLEAFGAYMLAVTLTSIQTLLVQPIHTAIYPQLTQLIDSGETKAAAVTFLRWSRRVGALALPLGCFICLFPEPIASVWLADPELAKKIALPTALLGLGSLLNALCTLPYTLQLAAGWASLGFYSNLVGLCVMVPGILVLTPRLGMTGAAIVWAALNAGYLLIQVPLMFRRLLPEYKLSWYREAFVVPTLISLPASGLGLAITVYYATETIPTLLIGLVATGIAAGALLWRLKTLEERLT